MAVYTELSTDDLDGLLSAYDIGRLQTYAGVTSGVENTNYLLHTAGGRFILTLYEKRVEHQDLPFFLELKEHLAAKGLPVPQPVPGTDGRVLRTIRARRGAIFTFLEGRETEAITPHECAQVGRMLARLHLAGAEIPSGRPNRLSVETWPGILANCPIEMDAQRPGLRRELENECVWLAENWPVSLPEGIIHADLFPDNLLFQDGKIEGVIDFYFACRDFLAYDLAVCLSAWCFGSDNRFRPSHAQAMTDAYRTLRPLTAEEISAMPILLRGCCLRFSLTRLADFYAPGAVTGDAKDPGEFLERLRFFGDSLTLDIW